MKRALILAVAIAGCSPPVATIPDLVGVYGDERAHLTVTADGRASFELKDPDPNKSIFGGGPLNANGTFRAAIVSLTPVREGDRWAFDATSTKGHRLRLRRTDVNIEKVSALDMP